jgi:hypothetical protein
MVDELLDQLTCHGFFLRENDEILDEARSIGIFRSKKLGDRMRFNGISLSMQN